MRFYLDEMLPPRAAVIGRGLGLDVVSSHETGRNELPDDALLRLAGEERRCIVTRNAKDFHRWTVEFMKLGRPHGGVLIVPRSLPDAHPERIAHALPAYARAHPEGMPSYGYDYL